jgi:hypothetical protein
VADISFKVAHKTNHTEATYRGTWMVETERLEIFHLQIAVVSLLAYVHNHKALVLSETYEVHVKRKVRRQGGGNTGKYGGWGSVPRREMQKGLIHWFSFLGLRTTDSVG